MKGAAMRLAYMISAGLLMVCAAQAQNQAQDQNRETRETQGLRGKTLDNCKADMQRLCAAARLKQECLVARWAKLSSDCQDGLASPMRGGGD